MDFKGLNIFFKKKKILFLYFLREGEDGERERSTDVQVLASHVPPTGALACNPGIRPDSESNQ